MDLSKELAIGIDIGGTNTKWGLVNHRGEIVKKGDLKTDNYPTIELFIDALYQTLSPVIKSAGKDKILKGIGIGAPNGNFYKGTIEYAPNLHWKGIIHLTDLVTKRFNLPASLTNDANAAAVGEMLYGAARGMKDFIMITLGTGVGSGIVANGHLIYGHDGFA
jgi:glucokinase